MILKLLFTFFLFISLSSATSVVDYCMADLSLPKGPAGFPCRNPANLTVDDFVYSGLAAATNTSNIFNVGAAAAFDLTFPALNGLGLTIARLDIGVGGVVPVHTHRVSELILVIRGNIVAGFIDSSNTPFFKVLNPGDIMIFPPTLLHFQVNNGTTPALAFVSLNSADPGAQLVSTSLFGNMLPAELVERMSLIDAEEVRRLKAILGGTN